MNEQLKAELDDALIYVATADNTGRWAEAKAMVYAVVDRHLDAVRVRTITDAADAWETEDTDAFGDWLRGWIGVGQQEMDRRTCQGRNSNICVAEGCYGEACVATGPAPTEGTR